MRVHCRREFLTRSAAVAGAMGLGATRLLGAESAATPKPVEMSIARWAGPLPGAPAEIRKAAVALTERAVGALGGMKRFVRPGDVVWVKPNIGWDRTPELAANTNPDVVATIVRLCLEAGAKKVKVGDNPCDLAPNAYQASGIAAAAQRAGAEVVYLDKTRFRETSIGGERVKSIPLYPEILDCDLLINVPVVKHHGLANVTLCMKNYMGVIENRRSFHQAIPECLADLTRFLKPRLCILDGIRILTAHGPKGGNPADVQTKMMVAAGVDIVALDAWGCELLGRDPKQIGSVVKGQEVGLGRLDYRSLELREMAVS